MTLQLSRASKSFGADVLFENLSFEIKPNDKIAIIGRNGCGKTTLLNMIGAIEKIDDGKIIVDGIDIRNKRNHLNYFRTKIGFLFQNFALVDNKTVKENLKFIRKDCKTNLSIE